MSSSPSSLLLPLVPLQSSSQDLLVLLPSTASEMSSSPTPGFQVFLSFRGSETRNGFTSHLSHALKQSGIRTFLDEEDLQKGDIITETIRQAIEGSAVCIPVLSESYAESRWCLMELAMMVKCSKKIIPIFYDVEPTVVRHQSSSYKAAFDRHRLRFDEKTINEWKGALKRVAEISGYDRKNTANGNEAKLVSMVVERISCELKKETSSGCSIDPEETESDAELQAIEEKLRQQKDPYLMELEQHRKKYEMHVKLKMRVSSSADRENLFRMVLDYAKDEDELPLPSARQCTSSTGASKYWGVSSKAQETCQCLQSLFSVQKS